MPAAPRTMRTPVTEMPCRRRRPGWTAAPRRPGRAAGRPAEPRPSRARFRPASRPSSHSGTVATSSAASPDGTVRSATPTTPLAHQQQDADRRAGPPLHPGRPAAFERRRPPAPEPQREHDQAGHQAAGRRHQQRRHRLDPDPDGQVGAAPHDVDDEQADPGGKARAPYRYRFLIFPNGLGALRTHNHRACQAVAPLASGRIAIFARDTAIAGAASTLLACPISPGARGCAPRCSSVRWGWPCTGWSRSGRRCTRRWASSTAGTWPAPRCARSPGSAA